MEAASREKMTLPPVELQEAVQLSPEQTKAPTLFVVHVSDGL